MQLEFTPDQKAFQAEIRKYFDEMMTPELVDEIRGSGEGGGPLYQKALRQMGADGLLGVGWPKEYGGQGRSLIDQYIFADEVQRAGFPLPFRTPNTAGAARRIKRSLRPITRYSGKSPKAEGVIQPSMAAAQTAAAATN